MLAVLDDALRNFGEHPSLLSNRSLALTYCGRQREGLAAAERAVAISGGELPTLINRLSVLPYHPEQGGAAPLLAAGRDIARRVGPPARVAHGNARDPERRLRVGVLSGCLGVHPVGWLTLAGLEALPADGFELACYALRTRRDWLAARYRARATLWRDVADLPDEALAETIRDDGVDVLLDCGGYGEGGRLLALQHRPAPVQVKWVGVQFASTGLDCVDWMLTDARETPPGFEPFYSERLLRLPDGYVCYTPPPYAPEPGPLPALRNGYVTFGCFNNLAKVTPVTLAAWAEVLRQVPGARLRLRTHALADPATRADFVSRLAALGLDPDRLDLLGGCPHAEMLAAYRDIDIALDPFPYTGGLTVCEALWMGVPVVALAGDGFAARHALSHLGNAGLPGWVAGSVEDYVRLARYRASDLAGLAALRAGLRDQVRQSPLCDAPRFGQALGQALRHAWRDWCARN
ncbi:glycosyltransferase [Roseomonas sp. NAR14]|uniref:Glycosyltransferase n=2 Tax=Roseomonas acroporae TaxID=2937791 RepID=A0A9X1YDW2_9PROT|nr:glycosyltransferase [Roseomonas acroporae]